MSSNQSAIKIAELATNSYERTLNQSKDILKDRELLQGAIQIIKLI